MEERAGDDGVATDGGGRGRRPSRRERWGLRQALPIALGVGAGLVLADVAVATVFRLRSILVLLLLSLFLSFAIEPAVQWLQQRGLRRGVGTGLVFLGAIGLATGFVVAVSGLVSDQVRAFADAAPRLLDDLADRADTLPDGLAEPVSSFLSEQSAGLPDRFADIAGSLAGQVVGVGSSIIGALFSTLTVALLTFYLVADGPRLRYQLSRRLEPSRQRRLLAVWELAIGKTGGYVYSRLVLAVVSALVHITAFTLLGLPYPAALGVFVGLLSSLVPVIGTYLAGVLPVVVALSDPGVSVLAILAVIVVYQQVENYLVQPKITEHTLSLHPAVAFLSVLVGAALLGPVGALLALPASAIVAAIFSTYADEHEVLEHELTTTPAARVDVAARDRRRATT